MVQIDILIRKPALWIIWSVLCDETGHMKFPFSYLADVTLLTLAQARLSPSSAFAQAGSTLFTLITIFGRLHPQPANCFNSSRGGLELVPRIKKR